MTNLYRQNNRASRRAMLVSTALVAVLYLVDLASGGVLRAAVRDAYAPVVRPAAAVHSYVAASGLFSSRATLARQAALLQARVDELTLKAAAFDILQEENAHLRELVRLSGKNNGRAAHVMRIGDSSPYGTFMIDAGSSDGVSVGDMLLLEGGFAIGTITSATANSALVGELFAPRRETEALVANTRITLSGKGGGNAYGQVPRGVRVRAGDTVIVPSLRSAPIAVVGRVVSDPASAYSEVYVRVPVDLNTIQYVYVSTSSASVP